MFGIITVIKLDETDTTFFKKILSPFVPSLFISRKMNNRIINWH